MRKFPITIRIIAVFVLQAFLLTQIGLAVPPTSKLRSLTLPERKANMSGNEIDEMEAVMRNSANAAGFFTTGPFLASRPLNEQESIELARSIRIKSIDILEYLDEGGQVILDETMRFKTLLKHAIENLNFDNMPDEYVDFDLTVSYLELEDVNKLLEPGRIRAVVAPLSVIKMVAEFENKLLEQEKPVKIFAFNYRGDTLGDRLEEGTLTVVLMPDAKDLDAAKARDMVTAQLPSLLHPEPVNSVRRFDEGEVVLQEMPSLEELRSRVAKISEVLNTEEFREDFNRLKEKFTAYSTVKETLEFFVEKFEECIIIPLRRELQKEHVKLIVRECTVLEMFISRIQRLLSLNNTDINFLLDDHKLQNRVEQFRMLVEMRSPLNMPYHEAYLITGSINKFITENKYKDSKPPDEALTLKLDVISNTKDGILSAREGIKDSSKRLKRIYRLISQVVYSIEDLNQNTPNAYMEAMAVIVSALLEELTKAKESAKMADVAYVLGQVVKHILSAGGEETLGGTERLSYFSAIFNSMLNPFLDSLVFGEAGELLGVENQPASKYFRTRYFKDSSSLINEKMPTLHLLIRDRERFGRFLFALSLMRMIFPYEIANSSNVPNLEWADKTGIKFNLREISIAPVSESFRRHLFYVPSRDSGEVFAVEIKMPGEDKDRDAIWVSHFETAKSFWQEFPDNPQCPKPILFAGLYGTFNLYGRRITFNDYPLGMAMFEYKAGGKRLRNILQTEDEKMRNEIPLEFSFLKVRATNRFLSFIPAQTLSFVLKTHFLGYRGVTKRGNDLHLENFWMYGDGTVEFAADFGAFQKTRKRPDGSYAPCIEEVKQVCRYLGVLSNQEENVEKKSLRDIFGKKKPSNISFAETLTVYATIEMFLSEMERKSAEKRMQALHFALNEFDIDSERLSSFIDGKISEADLFDSYSWLWRIPAVIRIINDYQAARSIGKVSVSEAHAIGDNWDVLQKKISEVVRVAPAVSEETATSVKYSIFSPGAAMDFGIMAGSLAPAENTFFIVDNEKLKPFLESKGFKVVLLKEGDLTDTMSAALDEALESIDKQAKGQAKSVNYYYTDNAENIRLSSDFTSIKLALETLLEMAPKIGLNINDFEKLKSILNQSREFLDKL